MNHTFHLNNLFLSDEFGAEGFSGPGPSHEGSFRSGPPSHDLSPGPSPGIGFAPGPGSVPTGPPGTNYNNIQIPPGAHAPANTPAELQPFSGTTQKLNLQTRITSAVRPESLSSLWFVRNICKSSPGEGFHIQPSPTAGRDLHNKTSSCLGLTFKCLTLNPKI